MSWETPAGDSWNAGESSGAPADTWGGGGGGGDAGPSNDGAAAGAAAGGGDSACRICNQEGHFARECPNAPAGSGDCFNCGQPGHNKADCPEPPKAITCKLCGGEGHKAVECKSRRIVDWSGVPEMAAEDAWTSLVDAAAQKDLDAFRASLRAYARALNEEFNLVSIEEALRQDNFPVYLIAIEQETAANMTIIDMIGNPDCKYVLSIQLSAKPRRPKMAQGWPSSPEENLERLKSAGLVQDCGVPLCGNCGELGHVRKHCTQEKVEVERNTPEVKCIYCQENGHRARDCTKARVNPFACRNCKQEGHNSKECPEPRSAEDVECRKCNQMGHFSKDCPNVEARTCRNCGSADHMAKECTEPRNPATVTCRNCDEVGHFSRDCKKPKDWSKVQCTNCQEFGHTIKRCKAPIADGGYGEGGPVEPVAAGGGWDNNAAPDGAADAGGWGSGGGDAGGSGDNAGGWGQSSTW